MHGSRKYGDHNWKHVAPLGERYFDAAMRHMAAWRGGEELDAESGLPHLAHTCCCLLFILEDGASPPAA